MKARPFRPPEPLKPGRRRKAPKAPKVRECPECHSQTPAIRLYKVRDPYAACTNGFHNGEPLDPPASNPRARHAPGRYRLGRGRGPWREAT